jgi:hypothetical protein
MITAISALRTDVSNDENQKRIEKTKENDNFNMNEAFPNPQDISIFEDLKPHKLFISDILY